jgi:hypothetical protein
MPSDVDDGDDQRLSRRAALKGIGAVGGAAAAWTAPTILTTSAAAAATIVPHPCANSDCGPDGCNDQAGCGNDTVTQVPCTCVQNFPAGNGCTCTQNVPCSSLVACSQVAPLCPPGFACQIGCCGTPLCFPLCA